MSRKEIQNAKELLARYGRNGDLELAHISPSERRLIAAWKGSEDINPRTGLPEYFSFKKVLKGVAKAAGAAAGAYFGGPAGAAVGGALATKLTGGSWKSALGTGLLSGISAYGLQQSGAGDYLGIGSLGKGTDLLGRVTEAAAPAAAGAASSGIDWKSLLPVAAVGIGALAGGAKTPKTISTAAGNTADNGSSWQVNTKPLDRKYQSADDYYNYGQYGGEHEFYDEVNPDTSYAYGGAVRLAAGGSSSRARDTGSNSQGVGGRDRDRSNPGTGGRPGGVGKPGVGGGFSAEDAAKSKAFRDIRALGDPTSIGGMMNRVPGPMTGIGNILAGKPTPNDIVQTFGQGIGLLGGNPMGQGMGLGIGMGQAVTDVQKLRDMGMLPGRTYTDPSMGRVDIVDGKAYSHGSPAADDREKNVGGLGGGMVGGHGGGDALGKSILSKLAATFSSSNLQPSQAQAQTPGPSFPAPVSTAPIGRTPQSPGDYYTYGERPEWEFFTNVNPVTSAATGGTIKGKGSGQSDEIPALLSDNEHVVDAATIAALGDGSSDEGHRRMEKLKAAIRKRAGYKKTDGIPPKQKGIGSLLKEVA